MLDSLQNLFLHTTLESHEQLLHFSKFLAFKMTIDENKIKDMDAIFFFPQTIA